MSSPDVDSVSTATQRRGRLLKAVLLIIAVIGVFPFVCTQVGSSAEAFWLLLPPVVFVASFLLNVIPRPRLNSTGKWARISSIVLLIAFPIGYYGFLVTVTHSAWWWRELLTVMYFFGLSFELCLLYVYQIACAIEEWSRRQVAPRWWRVALVSQKAVFYSVLIPFLFVVFAVHRPKLLPTAIAGVPLEATEQIEFLSRDGRTMLRGVFLKPQSPRGTVIVCHGVGANHSDIEVIHQTLRAARFQVFTFDFRGHGRSDGHTITYGWNERLDVLGAYDACLSRPDVDLGRLFALGVSMGGASLAMSLPEMPKVKAAVLDSAFADMASMVDHQFRILPKFCCTPLRQVARATAWLETGADINELAPASTISKIQISLLLIHGADDRIIPVDHVHRLVAAAGRKVELHIEPDSPHIGTVLVNATKYRQLIEKHFE